MSRSAIAKFGKSVPTYPLVASAGRKRVHSEPRTDKAFIVGPISAPIPWCELPMVWLSRLLVFFLLWCMPAVSAPPALETWVPIRWTGGPLEVAWQTHLNRLPIDASVRDTLAHWYEPVTLSLLDGSPANCLLVTWSAAGDPAAEAEQQQLVRVYTEAAHKRGLAVLGLVYATGDALKISTAAARAALDGLVLEGEFTAEFPAALRRAAGSVPVVEITKDAAPWRWKIAPIVAVVGVAPNARNLSEMGIRGTPSSEPWIQSNIWLVRSLRSASASRALWISTQFENPSDVDYLRAVADAGAAGGRWIVSLDDALRAKLRARDASAIATWRRVSSYLKFSEDHPGWRTLAPFGNVGIVLDQASANRDAEEYLNLVWRRHVPYRLVERSELSTVAASIFRVLVCIELEPPSAAERKLLQDFAERGGLVLVGPSWGGAPTTEPFAEVPTGKGRVFVYKDPDPESVARDLKELVSDEDLGVVPFNVPSIITLASGDGQGQPLVVQLVNYFDHPVEVITLRVAGKLHAARLEAPEGTAVDLPLREAEGSTEVTIPKVVLWAAVSMQ